MSRFGSLFLFLFICMFAAPAFARHETVLCGTAAESRSERNFLHRQALRARARAGLHPMSISPAANRDAGDIAIIEDHDGVVARQNAFNLSQKTLRFTPAGPDTLRYRYAVIDQPYDAATASTGTQIAALDDDDSRALALPFAFPFYGATYRQLYVNSDGNLTFTTPDSASTERSLGRMTSGPPRIAPLFDDLDPARAGSVRVLAGSSRFVVSWVSVPEWQTTGIGTRQTFQVSLF